MRSDPKLKIASIWLNVYLGGRWTAESEHHLYVDEVAIGETRIGR